MMNANLTLQNSVCVVDGDSASVHFHALPIKLINGPVEELEAYLAHTLGYNLNSIQWMASTGSPDITALAVYFHQA